MSDTVEPNGQRPPALESAVFARLLAELHRDSLYPMMGKDAWVAGADRREAPGPKPVRLGRRLRLRRQPPGSWQLWNGGDQRGVSKKGREPTGEMSGDSNSDPPPTCTDPHSHHAFVLSVIDASVWLFLDLHLRFSMGLLGVDVCQPRSDQSTLAFLTQSVTLPRDHQCVTVME